MIQIIISRRPSAANRATTMTFKFGTMEAARAFVAKYNYEDRLIDILA